MEQDQPRDKFHGRVRGSQRSCAHPGCRETGEFRAPGYRAHASDGPGDYRWLCLTHVKEFNARYNFFNGMSREEIEDAQMPMAGWATETRAFAAGGGVDQPPKWADFRDPLDAISARFRAGVHARVSDETPISPEDRAAFKTLSLPADADAAALRARYSELVRKFHPDRNGGDRGYEKALQAVVEAYQHLRARRLSRG